MQYLKAFVRRNALPRMVHDLLYKKVKPQSHIFTNHFKNIQLGGCYAIFVCMLMQVIEIDTN